MKYVWQHISQGDMSTAGSSCSKSYLEVMWRKGFFGESGISWDITVSARTSDDAFPYESLSRPVRLRPPCQHFSKPWNPNFGGRFISGFTACLLNVQPTKVPSPPGGHGHLLAKCALREIRRSDEVSDIQCAYSQGIKTFWCPNESCVAHSFV